MKRLRDICTYVRSKNAGPFWVTIDLFFDGAENYARYKDRIDTEAVKALIGGDVAMIKKFNLDSLCVVKLSYPRQRPQGGVDERDMHSGQQYVRLLDMVVGS